MSLETLQSLNQDALSALEISNDLFLTRGMEPVLFNSWANQIQLIEHLVLFSNVLMVMSAKRGSGKSTFISFLAHSLPDEIERVVLPTESLAMENNELIRAIGKALHCSINGHFLQEKLTNLHQRARELKRHFLFIIDDADQLTEDNLATISQLINMSSDHDGYLHFFLLGFERLKGKIRDLSLKEGSCQSHILELNPLKADEIKLYLNHCYSHVKGEFAELPLSDDEINGLKSRSDGNIAYIQSNCRAMLNKKFMVSAEPPKPKFSLQKKWFLPIGGCFALVVAVSLFFSHENKLIYEKKAVLTNAKPSKHYKPINFKSVKQEFELTRQLHQKQDLMKKPAVAVDNKRVVEDLVALPSTVEADKAPEKKELPKQTVKKKKAIEPIKKEDEPTLAEKQAALEASRKDVSNVTPVLIDKVVVLPKPVKPVPVTSTPLKRVKMQPTKPKTVVKPVDGYGIQLIGASSLDSLKMYVYQRNLQKQVVYYKTKNRGKDWYVALMGPYPDHKMAIQKLKMLPPQIRKGGSWVRSTKGLGSPNHFKIIG